MKSILIRYPLASFFAVTIGLSWLVWIPAAWRVGETLRFYYLLGLLAPAAAAILVRWAGRGWPGVKSLLGGLWSWRVRRRWYVLAFFGPAAAAALALGIDYLLGGQAANLAGLAARFEVPPEQAPAILLLLPILYLVSVLSSGAIPVEFGWRGYAQPRLQRRLGWVPASLLIGALWLVWLAPLAGQLSQIGWLVPLWAYLPLGLAFSVLEAWIFDRTSGSILLCVLFSGGVSFALTSLGLLQLSGTLRVFVIFCGLAALSALLAAVFGGKTEDIDLPMHYYLDK